MIRKIKFIITVTIFLMAASRVTAESRLIFLDKELKNASFVGMVVVDDYDNKGNIIFHSTEYKDTINTAEACCNFGYNKNEIISYEDASLNERFPKQKDTVLIVINSTKQVSLFAKLIGKDFRFWSPWPIQNVSIFVYNKPVKKLPSRKEKKSTFLINGKYKDYYCCDDGCLLPKEYLKKFMEEKSDAKNN